MPGLLDDVGGLLGGLLGGGQPSPQNPMTAADLYGGGLKGRLASSLAIMNPQAGNAYLQQRMMPLQYQALAQQYGPNAAIMLMSNPQLLTELAKPQVVAPGGSLMAGIGIPGLTGQPQQPQQMPPPQAGPLSPSLAAAAGRSPGLPPAPQAPPALTMPQGGAPAQSPAPQPQAGGGVTLGQNTNGTMSDDVATGLAQRYLLGDKNALPAVGIGSGGLAVMNRNKVMSIARQLQQQGGISDAEVTRRIGQFPAYEDAQKRLATVESNMGTAGIEFDQIWPQFMAAIQKYGNGRFPTWNALTQFVSQHAGDPNVAPLQQYITTLRNIYGRAISTRPQGPTVSDKEHFDESMSKTWNPAQLTEVGNAISNEINAAHNSIPKMKNRLDVEFGLGKDPGPDIINQAKAAMAKGVPREAVIKRLGENGYSARGF